MSTSQLIMAVSCHITNVVDQDKLIQRVCKYIISYQHDMQLFTLHTENVDRVISAFLLQGLAKNQTVADKTPQQILLI